MYIMSNALARIIWKMAKAVAGFFGELARNAAPLPGSAY
jgi:hypothetical protein